MNSGRKNHPPLNFDDDPQPTVLLDFSIGLFSVHHSYAAAFTFCGISGTPIVELLFLSQDLYTYTYGVYNLDTSNNLF